MSKKMKGAVFDSSNYGSYEDAKARVKHQGLLQDYHELQKEAEAARNKLEAMKQRKLTLLAEVRFLRRRCKYLRKNKILKPPQVEEPSKLSFVETFQHKNKKKNQSRSKKEATMHNLPPIFNLNQKGRVYMQKEVLAPNVAPIINMKQKKKTSRSVNEPSPSKATPASDRHYKGKTNRGKEIAPRKLKPVIDLNQTEWTYNSTALRNSAQAFDLAQKGSSLGNKEAAVLTTRAPVFDLNQISLEEEENQENTESFRFEDPRKALVRGGLDEQPHNDLMLSVCRNIGDTSTSRPGKRKISWQDPVALRV